VIESRAGSRAFTAPTDTAICSAHTAALHDLAAELYERDDLATLRFSAAALDRLKELHDQVEPELAAGGELTLIRGWGSKYLGAIARIAACLHLGDNGGRGSMVIPAGTVDRAIALGEYFTAHALNVLTAFGADPVALDAEYLLTRVQSLPRRLTGITAREIHQAARARFRARKDMDPALQRLVENGHLIEIGRPANTPKRGRPTSEMYRLANTAGRA
jgi:replicative DNA helicase